MKSTRDIFEAELQKRGIAFDGPDGNGCYSLQRDDDTIITVCLENVERNYIRDKDPDIIVHFVEQILHREFETPPWEKAQTMLHFSAEPSDHQFCNTVFRQVTESLCQVLVLTDHEEKRITWVTDKMIQEWGVTKESAIESAGTNMDRLLEGKEVELTDPIDGMRLGMVPIDSVFKASIIFAPGFKTFAAKKLDWPILSVIPCRDFIYILSEKDKALLNRLGGVVQREYRQSGYPITTEVLRISNEGIEAIGKYTE